MAAFILNVALTRALALQRPQIAALKALGYSNRELAWHYVKWALVIAAAGALAGVAGGAWLGSGIISIYNQYFRFPVLDYHLSVGVAVAARRRQPDRRRARRPVGGAAGRAHAAGRSHASGSAGAVPSEPVGAARGALPITPATRMVLRNLERQPVRSAISIVGIAFAVAVLFVGLSFIDVMDELLNAAVRAGDAAGRHRDLRRAAVGPARCTTSDTCRAPWTSSPCARCPSGCAPGTASRTLAITGTARDPRLNRVVSRRRAGADAAARRAGPVADARRDSRRVAGRSRSRWRCSRAGGRCVEVPVAALVDDSMGLQAYMDIDALRRLLREGARDYGRVHHASTRPPWTASTPT